MTNRRTSRRSALQLLYQADVWSGFALDLDTADEVLDAWRAETHPPAPAWQYVRDVVLGAAQRVERLDEVIAQFARGWTLERIACVDKNILRIALYEMLYRTDIPVPVAINEAVELAKRYATDDTAGFVNGILAAVQRELLENRPDTEGATS
jgi:transcription antitermination protein NusB